MKLARIFSLLLIILLSSVFLFSCIKENGANEQGSSNNPPNSTSKDAIWTTGDTLTVVVNEQADLDLSPIRDSLLSIGVKIKVVSDEAAAQPHELVIGETNRAISKDAYRRLDVLETNNEELNAGWVIYSLNGSLGIAYNSGYAFDESVNYFVSEIADYETLVLKNGIVAEDSFDKIEYIEAKRWEARESYFVQIEKKLGKAAANEVRHLFTLYGTNTYTWLANLYDPVSGGFYYSNSGRNTIGYLPDLESTWQALRHLRDRGMFVDYGNDISKALPEEIKNQIIRFTQSLQSGEDGRFYHPQWSDVNDSRLGRDLTWATNMLTALGAEPLYEVPNKVKDDVTGISSVSLTNPLFSSRIKAVSKVISVAGKKDYLSSIDKWDEYIKDLNISENSYSAGNKLNAIYGEIKAAGDEYVDYLINYLDNTQNDENGLWESQVTYQSVNGLMKISSTYSALDRKINETKIEAAMASAMQIALDEELPNKAGIVYVYNPWVSMSNLLSDAPSSSREALRKKITDKATDFISVTVEKLIRFYKEDGSFSYHELYSAAASQGAPVALPNSKEGDVNATTISCSTVDIMLDVLGVETPPFYCPEDYEYFTDLLLSMGEIIKDEPEKGAITFDEFDKDLVLEDSGVLPNPDSRVTTTINSADEEKNEKGLYKWFQNGVVQNPDPNAEEGDYIYKVNTFIDADSTSKNMASTNITNKFKMDTSTAGSTYILDMDIMVAENDNTDYKAATLMQIFFDNGQDKDKLFSINILTSTKNGKMCLRLGDNYAGLDGKKNTKLVDGIAVNEWFNLRIECYKIYDDNNVLTVKAKIFVNGEYRAESDAGEVKTGETVYTDALVDRVRIGYYRGNNAEFYLNNIVSESATLAYVSQVPPPDPLSPVTFEGFNPESGSVLEPEKNITNMEHDTLTYEIVADPKNKSNKVLKVTKTENDTTNSTLRTVIDLQTEKEDGKLYVFEADIYMGTLSGTTWLDLSFTDNPANQPLSNIRLGANSGSIKIRENVSNISGNTDIVTNVAETDTWFTIGIVLNYVDSANVLLDVYINGELVIDDLNAYNTSQSESFNPSTFRIRYLSSGKVSSYFDNLIFKKTDGYVYNGGHKVEEEGAEDIVITFDKYDPDNGDSPEQPSSNLTNDASGTLNTVFEITEDPKDSSNKVMLVTDGEGTTKSYSQLDLSVIDESVNRFVFESKIFVDSKGTTEVTECLGIAFTGKDAKLLSKVFVGVENGKIKIVESNTYPTAEYEILGADVAAVDTWFKLRMELTFEYNDDKTINKESLLLKVYVNDIFVGELNTYNTARWDGSNAAGYTVSGVRLGYEKTSALKVYFDDISLVQKTAEVTEQSS